MLKKTKDSIEKSHDLIKTKNAIKQCKYVNINIKWHQMLAIACFTISFIISTLQIMYIPSFVVN